MIANGPDFVQPVRQGGTPPPGSAPTCREPGDRTANHLGRDAPSDSFARGLQTQEGQGDRRIAPQPSECLDSKARGRETEIARTPSILVL